MELYTILQASLLYLSNDWKSTYSNFLNEEHLKIFAEKLWELYGHKGLIPKKPPFFEEEITPDITTSFGFFKELTSISICNVDDDLPNLCSKWAQILETTPFEHILIILGQRHTAATIKTAEGIPPTQNILLDSCFTLFNNQICMATRAWEKHIGRSKTPFWGEMKGNAAQKETKVRHLIVEMLENKTWWNIFFHYKHKMVYEIRVESGHGIRWSADGTKLIGFLEPFL